MTVPKGVKMPADHKTAAQSEAEGAELITLEFRGLTLTFPADFDDWPLETVIAFEEGKSASAIRGVLDPVQWAALMATKPLKRDLEALFVLLNETLGTSGN